ncbi:hypothetical protein JCM6882_007563 [Rhodosporidiobolus microsporus]
MASQSPMPSSTAASPHTSPSSNEPVKAASLMGLPEELKKLIVREVKEGPGRYFYSSAEEEAKLGAVVLPNLDSVRMLASTNRAFFRLSSPVFWEELRLDEGSTASLLHAVKYLLPKHGRDVKFLALQPCRQDNGWLLPETIEAHEWVSNASLSTSIVKEAEALSGVSSSGLSKRVRKLRSRGLLLAAAIRLCPKVVRVELEQFDWELGDKVPGRVYEVDHTMEEVKRNLGASLVDLTVYFRHKTSNSTEHIGALLTACPNLTSLVLVLDFPLPASLDRRALGDGLSGLRRLKKLVLGWGAVLDDRLLRLPFPFSLSSLVLHEDNGTAVRDFASYNTFFTTLSPTLTKLNWYTSDVPIPVGISFPSLPHLNDLVFRTLQGATVLRTFADSPLKNLEIQSTPFIDAKAWCDFIESKRETLRRVSIFWQAVANVPRRTQGFSAAEVREIETKCGSLGIEYGAPD